jgi:hypothetical protein
VTVVDTTVWIDYLGGTINPHTDWLENEFERRPLALTDLILCEILQGVRDEFAFRRVRRELSRFTIFATGGERLAVVSAQNYRRLRAHGHTVRKTIDCLIASFCILEGHALLHRDRDFDLFEQQLGLQVIHP